MNTRSESFGHTESQASSELLLAALLGLSAVALGAFGAHGLEGWLGSGEDLALKRQWWGTAAHYHLIHSVVLAVVGVNALATRTRWLSASAWCLAAGVVLFSGSLYTMALTGTRWLGAITPFGGLLLMAGWACLGMAAMRGRTTARAQNLSE